MATNRDGVTMDAGRQWALETFGMYGPYIRAQVASFVKAEHECSLDAQEASNHHATRNYGLFYSGILERFRPLGELPDAALVQPANAPYTLPVINGVALFPWRYGKSRRAELEKTRFGTSDARLAMSSLRTPPTQGVLDYALPDPGLDEDELKLVTALQGVARAPTVSTGKLVVVAVASSVRGLFEANWGEVEMDSDGFVEWAGFRESLLPLVSTAPVSMSPTGTFTAGDPPAKFPQRVAGKANRSTDE